MVKTAGGLLGVLVLGLAIAKTAWAGSADYVYTPTVEYGEREIDFKLGANTAQAGNSGQAASIGYGYGATEHWFTEVYLKQERNGSDIANLAEWENKFQLSETGQYPVDIGIITELEAPLSSNAPWEFKVGGLFQTEFGKLQLNGNLLFERAFGKADESGAPYATNIGYQIQAKYRWQPALEYGLQGIGEMGKWNAWDPKPEQNHRWGPAAFGKIALGNRRFVKYNAAWLIGVSNAAPAGTVRAQIEYEF